MYKPKIIIAGIGGVGGYFGGLLARHYHKSNDAEICFFSRGENLAAIRNRGLQVIKGENRFIAHPALATADVTQLGMADFILLCTKSYDLEETIKQLQPCIGTGTIIIPFLNGVDSRARIQQLLPGNTVPDGCAYIVTRLVRPGTVENSGNIQLLFFGLDGVQQHPQLSLLEQLMKDAGIEATLSANISTVIWEKYIFISPVATATSCFNNTIGELCADDEKMQALTALINEVKQLADAKQVNVAADVVEKTLLRVRSLPFGNTSSMHYDYQQHPGRTEIASLTGYVIDESKPYGLATPAYEQAFATLNERRYDHL